MEFDIDPQAIERINAIWETPYGIAAKFLFCGGLAIMFLLMVKRHNMSIRDALLAIVGFKKIPERDTFFNLLVGIIIVGCFGLLVVSMQVVINGAS